MNKYLSLSKELYIIILANTVNNVGNLILPIFTVLLTDKLGISIVIAGIIVMTNGIVSLIGTILGGILTDKFGIKRTYKLWYFLSCLCSFLILIIYENTILTIAILLLRTFSAAITGPAFNSMIACEEDPEKKKIGFTLLYISFNIGAAIAPLIAITLFKSNIYLLFIIDGITSIIAFLLITYIVGNKYQDTSKISNKSSLKNNNTNVLGNKKFIISLLISIIFFVYLSQINYSIPLFLKSRFGNEGLDIYSKLLSFNAILCVTLSVLVERLSNRIPQIKNLIISSFLFALSFIFLIGLKSVYLAYLFTLILTIAEIVLSVHLNVFILDNVKKDFIGRANTIVFIMRKIGFALGSFITGMVITNFDFNSLWILLTMCALIQGVAYIFIGRKASNRLMLNKKQNIS